MPPVHTAVIIGGGITGPVAATALAKAGIEADVYEAYPTSDTNGIGGSLALEPNGLAALGIVDAKDAVRAASMPITRSIMSIASKPGRDMPSPLGPRQLIDRGVLHCILRDRARRAGARMHHGKRLIGVDERPDGITAHFDDGTHASGDVLIGADGVRSTVRGLIDPDAPGAGYTRLLGFEGLVDDAADTADLTPGTMTFAFGKRAYYLYWKRPDGRIGWGVNLPSPQYFSLKQARAIPAGDWLLTIRETYADDTPGARLAADTTADTLQVVGALHIMPPVPRWYRDRLVLAGDSVHAPSNSTGQGASLAIESAIQLARCLRDLPDVPSAFAAYERLRRHRVEKIAARGAKISYAKAPGPIAQRMMRLLIPLMVKTMNIEKAMAAEQRYTIDWHRPATDEVACTMRLPSVPTAPGNSARRRVDAREVAAKLAEAQRIKEETMASAAPYGRLQYKKIAGKRMAYIDEGEGDAIVFQHGNPTSSYLWRNVMPHLEGLGRLVACDLIGMGASDKLDDSGPDRYHYAEHREYLFALWDALELGDRVVLVLHDWGSALGFDWANRHRDRVQGIAYMEAIAMPIDWADFPEPVRDVFQGFRSPQGESMVLEQNLFVEAVLPGAIQRKLTVEEMDHYRRPYINPGEDRRPTLSWPRNIPIEGEPADVVAIVNNYGKWLAESDVPKLFINAEPGAIVRGRVRDFVRGWPNQTEITVPGAHFIQEDSPDEIGTAIAQFVRGLRA